MTSPRQVGVSVSGHLDNAADFFAFLPPDARPDWARDIPMNQEITTMTTLANILDRAGVDTLSVLDAQVDVPVITGRPQAQGDLLILPRPNRRPATTPIPMAGALVVRAESSGGNTHSLHSFDGPGCFYDERPARDSDLVLGVLTVPDGATAFLVHTEEHGANAFGPGTYEIRRQREQADEIRMVAD